MRKHHNKLYYGKYRFKTEFKMPGSLMFYPTTDEHLLKIKKEYSDAPDMNYLADFIMKNRKLLKFRFQDRKAIFYTDYDKSLELIDTFWNFWTKSETVDPKFKDLDKNTIGCVRLPHGKYKYQVYLKKEAQNIMSDIEIETLKNFIDTNHDNCLVTNRDVLGLLNSRYPYFTGGYFYVSDEKFLTPIYMMAQDAIEKVIKFRKVKKNGSNKKTKR
tara:strand:- start:191 stop:835 length:645 start_codon:yes stop_codon:yes gene_type:complete